MSTALAVIVVAALILVLVVAAARLRGRDTAAEVPRSVVVLDPLVGGFVEALYRSASETEEPYVLALGRLREDPERSAREIGVAYRALDPLEIRARQALLFAAAALAHSSLVPLLSEVAAQPVAGAGRHQGSRAEEESMLRLIAVDGLEAILRAGEASAADALLQLVSSTDRGVQAAAVVALKYAEVDRDRTQRLRELLPDDRLYLLDVVRADVRDVPQIEDPRRHLRAPATTVDARPDPVSGERRRELEPSRRARVPKAGAGG